MDFDLVIRGGSVLDGSGAPAVFADVGVRDGRIAAIGDLRSSAAAEEIVAPGMTIAPGFIDVHCHTDVTPRLLDSYPDIALAGLRQGVTTEVCGNCGFTAFPTLPEKSEAFTKHTSTLFGSATPPLATLADYRAHIESMPMASNLAPLVGHGSIRAGVIGFDERPPTDDELRAMTAAAETAFADGAFGLSSGLIYPPGIFGTTDELVALARPGAGQGRLYATHMRNEGDDVIIAIDEALTVGREAGVGVQISHHKVSGRPNWGRSADTLAHIEAARDAGVDVTCDVYPYTAGSTSLSAVLPPWAHGGGGESMLARLQSTDERRRIGRDIETGLPGWEDFVRPNGWEAVVIATARHHTEMEGKSVAELADLEGTSPLDVACDLMVAERGAVLMVIHSMDEADVRRILSAPFTMIGSDGIPSPGKPHPRLAGTFARVLGYYAREVGLFDLPTAVHKMTGMPAQRFGIPDRGVVREGAVADLVVFDPATVIDGSTYAEPLTRPRGVAAVLVDGKVVIRDGEDTGARPGRMLTAR